VTECAQKLYGFNLVIYCLLVSYQIHLAQMYLEKQVPVICYKTNNSVGTLSTQTVTTYLRCRFSSSR